IEEIRSAKNCILFIDELHMLVGAGAAEGAVDAANILKPALARGELQAIGATTLDEYRKHIERDAALERRFQPVRVDEPSVDETVEILKGVRGAYEEHHKLQIADEALKSAAELSARYVSDRFLPDKAIDLIDEASARVRIRRHSTPPSVRETTKGIEALRREKDQAIANQQYEYAAELREREVRLQSKLEELEEAVQTERAGDQLMVTDEDIRDVVSMWTGIPLTRIASEETARLLEMEEFLRDRVIGQDEAIGAVAKAVRRARAGLKNPKRPIGVFMFLGPTGVGKTYLAETLSEFMFGSKDNIVRLDMSEFMEKHTVSRLVGSPPGYVGYDDGGQLTDLVRRRSYCLILLDEIEKAHPDVFNMLLQIFDDGHLSDAKGRKVDFRNTIIIMTSNVGSDLIRKDSRFGFTTQADDVKTAEQQYNRMKDQVTEEMKRVFRPEFLNRIDQSVVFHALAKEHIRQIVDLELRDVRDNLKEKEMSLEVSQVLLDYLGEKGFDPVFGARPLRRVIQNEVEDRLSDALLEGDFSEGSTIRLDYVDGEVTAEEIPAAAPEPPAEEEQEPVLAP
ncbi:MAG: ATP-dependent Clp protease ATP-binding subunit, partial [Chloroflexi bacterium]|nr:ATP-dependent Clp protease ATP-binding subunit [Chloroflexota bacterium]